MLSQYIQIHNNLLVAFIICGMLISILSLLSIMQLREARKMKKKYYNLEIGDYFFYGNNMGMVIMLLTGATAIVLLVTLIIYLTV